VVSDVPVDDEASVVTSRISRFAGAQSFGGAHRGRVCVRVFIGSVCVRVVSVCVVLCESKKKSISMANYMVLNLKKKLHGIKFNVSVNLLTWQGYYWMEFY
jgi:hypothetical protein